MEFFTVAISLPEVCLQLRLNTTTLSRAPASFVRPLPKKLNRYLLTKYGNKRVNIKRKEIMNSAYVP